MAITISNLRITPYTQKDTIKPVYGDKMTLTFTLPEAFQSGDGYILGLDYERVLIPTGREICALADTFTISGNDITFELEIRSARFRDWVSKIKKPMPCWLQIQRVRNGVYETILLDDVLALPSIMDGANTVYPGDPLADLLDTKLDKPETAGETGNVLQLGSNGETVWGAVEETTWDDITGKPNFALVTYTGDYTDLNNKPAIPSVGSGTLTISQNGTSKGSFSANQTGNVSINLVGENNVIEAVTFNGSSATITNKTAAISATIPTVNNAEITFVQGGVTKGKINVNQSNNATISFDAGGSAGSVSWNDVTGKPNFAVVASTGSYTDLVSKPTIPAVGSGVLTISQNGVSKGSFNANQTSNTSINLVGENNVVESITFNGVSATITNKTATISANIPTVNNAKITFTQGGVSKGAFTLNQSASATIALDAGASSVSWDEITSKPNFALVASTNNYNDLDNKPTIPTVNNATISLIQNGITKGTFTLNQNTDSSITLDAGGSNDYVDSTPYLCFTNEKLGTSTLYLTAANNLTLNLEYSFDKRSWSTYTFSGVTGQTITLSSKGDKVYFRGTNEKLAKSSGSGAYSYFTMTGKIAASGKVMSLLDATCTQEDVPSYAFPGLFKDCSVLTTAPEMPQKDLDSYCFYQMYRNCTSLQRAPEMMCDMLAVNAYSYIFAGCTNLFWVKIGFSTLGTTYSGSWLDGVSALGTLVAPSTLAYTSVGKNTVPSGWDVIRVPAQMDDTITSDSKNPVENSVLYTALASKANAVDEIQSTGATVTIDSAVANTHYACGEITTLTINACEKSIYETIVTFTNGVTPCAITLPANVNSTRVETPTANGDYILTIRYGVAIGYNASVEESSSSSSGGGGGTGTIEVTGCATASYNGTYTPYDLSGKGGTQTYSNGNAYIFRMEDDDNHLYWCIYDSIITDYAMPGTPSQYYANDASMTVPVSGWQNCSVIVNV